MLNQFYLADHRIFQVEGNNFLFLCPENAIFEIDSDLQFFLNECSRFKTISKEEFFSIFRGSLEEKQATFDHFLKCRILVCSEQQPQKYFQSDCPAIHTMVFHVTEHCNLGCDYCYYSSLTKSDRHVMSEEIAQKGVNFLIEHSLRNQISIVFFGGEPLLNMNLIRFIVNFSREKADAAGKDVRFSVTTNGTLLNERTIEFLKKHRFTITVSFDGLPSEQDRNRRFLNGSASYSIIAPKIKAFLDKSSGYGVVARVTIVKDASPVNQTFDHLMEMGFSEVGFAPVTSNDPKYCLTNDQMDILLKQFMDLSQRFLTAAYDGKFLGFTNLIDLLVTLHEGEVKKFPCGAGLGLFSLDYKGDLYLCQRLIGKHEFCMGNVDTGFDRLKLSEFRNRASLISKSECTSCWARMVCAGGCYHEALVRQKSIFHPNIHYCDWIKRWLDIGLDTYARLSQQRPDFLNQLCVLRGYSVKNDGRYGCK